MKILALDYGKARVGVAFATGKIAEPIKVLPHNEKLFDQIIQFVLDWEIEKLIIGLSENTMAVETKAFGVKLSTKINIPIIYQDETLSSYQVRNKLKQLPLKKRQGPIDHYAAAVILQNYLDDNY